jgi:hypothetical protein
MEFKILALEALESGLSATASRVSGGAPVRPV